MINDDNWVPLVGMGGGDWFGPLGRLREALEAPEEAHQKAFWLAAALGLCRKTETVVPDSMEGTLLPEVAMEAIQEFLEECREMERLLKRLEEALDDMVAWDVAGPDMAADVCDSVLDIWCAEYALQEAAYAARQRGHQLGLILEEQLELAMEARKEVEAAVRSQANMLVVVLDTHYLDNMKALFKHVRDKSKLHWLLQEGFTEYATKLVEEADQSVEEIRKKIHEG